MNGRRYYAHRDGNMEQAFDDISSERVRQDALRDMGKFQWTLADDHVLDRPWDGVVPLGEEFGEICRALMGEGDLREELVQLAACCVAWIEALDRQAANEAARQYHAESEALLEAEPVPAWHPEPTASDYQCGPQGAD